MFCLQGSLLAAGEPTVPAAIGPVERIELGRGAWLERAEGWLPGADGWYDVLIQSLDWTHHRRPMYERMVDVPRLTARFENDRPAWVDELADVFTSAYGRPFRGPGCNWYRSGADSVAWHADRVSRPGDCIVAIVSVGGRRPFRLRPRGGGRSLSFDVGGGDLLVMGGTAQAFWEHTVPKVQRADGRISVVYRSDP